MEEEKKERDIIKKV